MKSLNNRPAAVRAYLDAQVAQHYPEDAERRKALAAYVAVEAMARGHTAHRAINAGLRALEQDAKR